MDPAIESAFQAMRGEMLALEERMKTGWQAEAFSVGKRVEELEKDLKASATDGDGGKGKKFRHKDAGNVKPAPWDANGTFIDLSMEIRMWASALHDDYDALLDEQERDLKVYLLPATVDAMIFEDFKQMDKYLFQMLMATVKGSAKGYVINAERSGFQAWAQLVQHFDARTGVDKTVAYARLVGPTEIWGQSKDAIQARETMIKWELEKSEYVKKFGAFDEEAAKLGLKSIMPRSMFGESGSSEDKFMLTTQSCERRY